MYYYKVLIVYLIRYTLCSILVVADLVQMLYINIEN
jgi:hypothetical protein